MSEPERETVIVDRGGSGAGMIIGIVVVIALLFVGYLVFVPWTLIRKMWFKVTNLF